MIQSRSHTQRGFCAGTTTGLSADMLAQKFTIGSRFSRVLVLTELWSFCWMARRYRYDCFFSHDSGNKQEQCKKPSCKEV